jgi:hypothetical protein
MATADEGFQSEGLRAALQAALAGKPAELERLLARLGGAITAKPNVRLAAAFGAEVAALPGGVAPLLARLAGDDAAPDTDRVFLPMAAAHGWAGRIRAGRDVEAAWAALAVLAADERAPVRLGARDALEALVQREGGADALIARALSWLETDDREQRFGAAALTVATLGARKVIAGVRDHEALLGYLSRAIAEIAGAPRSAERSDARRRLLAAAPRTLATVVATIGERAQRWLAAECAAAEHPAARGVLSDAVVELRSPTHGQSHVVAETVRRSLEGSAKPPRDPTRRRPGTGRGKASRRTR